MENKYFTAFTQEGDLMMPCKFVTDLDEETVKLVKLDRMMSLYEQSRIDETFLSQWTMRFFITSQQDYLSAGTEEERQRFIEKTKSNWTSIYAQERPKMIEWINKQEQYVKECSVPIFQRRERVSVFLERIKSTLLSINFITPNGRIRQIPDNIPDDIFLDIYYLLADAICCRFQLNQYDGMYRDGLFHCLQYLDHRFWHNDFSKQYPNATEEDKDTLRRTNLLDIVTGRDNAEIDVHGEKYKCHAYLEDGCMFRLKIENSIPWNISNASKSDFKLDKAKRTMWSKDERYKVQLDAALMTYYLFIYENPDSSIEQLLQRKEHYEKCLFDLRSSSDKLREYFDNYANTSEESKRNKIKKDFERELRKRISVINKKVVVVLGEAYSIIVQDGIYCVPISKDIKDRPEN